MEYVQVPLAGYTLSALSRASLHLSLLDLGHSVLGVVPQPPSTTPGSADLLLIVLVPPPSLPLQTPAEAPISPSSGLAAGPAQPALPVDLTSSMQLQLGAVVALHVGYDEARAAATLRLAGTLGHLVYGNKTAPRNDASAAGACHELVCSAPDVSLTLVNAAVACGLLERTVVSVGVVGASSESESLVVANAEARQAPVDAACRSGRLKGLRFCSSGPSDSDSRAAGESECSVVVLDQLAGGVGREQASAQVALLGCLSAPSTESLVLGRAADIAAGRAATHGLLDFTRVRSLAFPIASGVTFWSDFGVLQKDVGCT